MQIWSRSVMIIISAVISLSHLGLFGNWNVLWNASINTKQNERNSDWRLSLCPSRFPQDVTLMAWKCSTPTASITQLNSAKNAAPLLHTHTHIQIQKKAEALFHTRFQRPTDAASAKTNIWISVASRSSQTCQNEGSNHNSVPQQQSATFISKRLQSSALKNGKSFSQACAFSFSGAKMRYNLLDLAINYTFPSIYDHMSALSSEQGHWLQ